MPIASVVSGNFRKKMKTIIIITFSVLLTACNFKLNRTNTTKICVDSAIIKLDSVKHCETRKDTITINGQKYIQILSTEKEQFNCLISLSGDTVVKSEDYYKSAEYIDINEDGDKDIRVYVISNTPNQCDNYLYDKTHKTFRNIENCDLDIKKINGKNLYYSYNSTGCSDMNWESYLSEIVDYKLIHLGHIEGQGCDYNTKETPQVIEIYKITNPDNEEKTLIEKLPYKKNIPKFDDKWNFIERYWTKNYSLFEKKKEKKYR
jgi:hypothetical protein